MSRCGGIAAAARDVGGLWRRSDGVAAVEFAVVLPLILLVLMAMIDFTRAFNERKRITLISSTIVELVSEQSTTDGLTVAQLDAIVTGSIAIMTPYPTDALAITVSAVQLTPKSDSSCCNAKVQWTATRNGALRPCNVLLAQVPRAVSPALDNILAAMIDPSLVDKGSTSQLIVADVVDKYTPIFDELASFFGGALQRTSYRALRAWGNLSLQSGASTVVGEQIKTCFTP